MNRHPILFSLALFAAFFICLPKAQANIHVGGDFQYRSVTLRGLNANVFYKHSPAVNVHLGYSFPNNMSWEAGFHSAKSSKSGASLKMKGIHFSILKHFPLDKEETVHAFGGIGLAQLRHHARHPAYRVDLSRAVPRCIAGCEYSLTSFLKLRGAFVWESSKSMTKKPERFNNTYGLSFGLKYCF